VALIIGTQLGSHEITALLGKGGMGEVYRARDLKLKREVAIKILPDEFARDADRVGRFQREAEALASLNHPNIAAIYDLQEASGSRFLVLELVEGETLANRLARGAIPVDESLKLAAQILDAIEGAHEKGVIHRDLKPANIKVTPEGQVKVLDFGLAKAFEGERSELSLSNSPTLTMAATRQGVILGTAAYMSPEQARGARVDKRTDIWAFGCILYEMLTGTQAFSGELISDVMASVLKSEPDYKALPLAVPPRLSAILQRCLQKDPKKRWRDAGDLHADLESTTETSVDANIDGKITPVPSRRRERVLWLGAILISVVLTWWIASMVVFRGRVDAPSAVANLVRFSLTPPEGFSLYAGGWAIPFSVSPDGHWLAFTATPDAGGSKLWVRPMGSETAQAIPGTDGATTPFWSPDSQWLGYRISNVLYRVRIPGGAPETISSFRGYTSPTGGAAWGGDVILFGGPDGTLFRVSAQGGSPSQVTTLDSSNKEQTHFWPQFLSDGRHFLYVAFGEHTRVYVDSISGGQRTLVMEFPKNGSAIQYVPGYLFYVEDMVLWAQPFDESNLRLSGERRRVANGVPLAGPGAAPFSVSHSGVLAYWTQSLIQQAAQLQWIDRKGVRLNLVGSPAVYDGFDLSRNGSRLVSAQVGKDGTNLWVYDLTAGGDGGVPLRFDSRATSPVWAPDGAQIAFLVSGALFMAPADPAARPVRLTNPSRNQLAQSFTTSGDRLVYEDWSAENGIDLVVLELKTKSVDRLPVNTNSNEFGARLSPDDRWLAYVTDQTGRNEVWVAAFPSGQPRRKISPSGGSHPNWKGDESELYFISAEGQLVAVPFVSGVSSFDVGTQANLFPIPGTIDIVAGSHNIYGPARDGQRFLVAIKSKDTKAPPMSVIVNWPELLATK
jgi:serine/threonine protein kinase